MIVGESPFYDDNERDMLKKIVDAPILYPDGLDADAQDIIQGFLIRDPAMRLGGTDEGVEAIKSHPFFAEIDWFKLERREVEAHWKPRLVRREFSKVELPF